MKSLTKPPVAENWIINASPVIALARVGRVELLARLPLRASVPLAVAEELGQGNVDDPARRAVETGMFEIIETPAPLPAILAWDLGKGETAVLSYAFTHPGWVAILDDGAARRCARSLSITITGTLAVVILAKQHNLIQSAVEVLQALRGADFRLDDSIIGEALARSVGEQWMA
jgi:predicted nucleic acid-binding protein